MTALLILLPLAYLFGSIPFGFLIARAKGHDLRREGSNNVGATNAGRVLGKKYFFLVFTLDALKAMTPAAVASAIVYPIPYADRTWVIYLLWMAAGMTAMIGHIFPVWLKFKGGKGVACGAGYMLGTFPILTFPGIFGLTLFYVVKKVSGYVSLGSIVAAMSVPVTYLSLAAWRGWDVLGRQWPVLAVALLMVTAILSRHRANIGRLIAGTEPREVRRSKSGGDVGPRSEPATPQATPPEQV